MSSSVFSWILALFIAAVMLFLGVGAKLMAAPESVYLFTEIDKVVAHYLTLTFMEPYGRMGIGILEVLTGVIVLLPATRLAGAFLSFIIASGAIGMHIAGQLAGPNVSNFGLGVTPATGGAPDYFLFGTAVVLWIASVVLLIVTPRH